MSLRCSLEMVKIDGDDPKPTESGSEPKGAKILKIFSSLVNQEMMITPLAGGEPEKKI